MLFLKGLLKKFKKNSYCLFISLQKCSEMKKETVVRSAVPYLNHIQSVVTQVNMGTLLPTDTSWVGSWADDSFYRQQWWYGWQQSIYIYISCIEASILHHCISNTILNTHLINQHILFWYIFWIQRKYGFYFNLKRQIRKNIYKGILIINAFI